MNRSVSIIIAGAVIATTVFVVGYFWLKNRSRPPQIEQTLAIIKPDAVRAHHTGKIIDRIEQEGYTIIDMRKVSLEREQGEKLYERSKNKTNFHELVDFMTTGPIVILILEKLNAISAFRDLMGDADPNKATHNALRKLFGTSTSKNAVHGSEDAETAEREIKFFFADRGRR